MQPLKRFVKYLDGRLLNHRIMLIRDLIYTSQPLRLSNSSSIDKAFHVNLGHSQNLFALLCHRFGSDKGSSSTRQGEHLLKRAVHNYADFYSLLFDNLRPNIGSVFECGIGTNNEGLISNMGALGRPGASLRVWREYFPNAQVVGVDIDPDTLFEEDRIRTFEMDQTDPVSIQNTLEKIEIKHFDLIVDDGLHTFQAARTLFENLITRLSLDGTYVIEDVNPWDVRKFENYFKDSVFTTYFVHLIRKGTSLGDNSLVVIRRRQV